MKKFGEKDPHKLNGFRKCLEQSRLRSVVDFLVKVQEQRGIEGLQELHERSRHPVVAIGGINQTNISEVIQYCEGVAVVGAIHDFENPQAAAEDLISQMNQRKSLCFCK